MNSSRGMGYFFPRYAFGRSFFNSKSQFNFHRANKGNIFQINFGNKNYMSKVLSLNQSSLLTSRIGLRVSQGNVSALSEVEESSDSVISAYGTDMSSKVLTLLSELSFIKEDCKWISGKPVTSGPEQAVHKSF